MTTTTKETNTNDTISVSDLSLYLSFLKHQNKDTGMSSYKAHRRVDAVEGQSGEPEVNSATKELALAIANGLNNIREFGYRDKVEWLFSGSAHMDEEQQESVSFFFYANKNNLLKVIDDIIETKSARPQSLMYFLRGIAMGNNSLSDEQLLTAFETIKQSHSLPNGNFGNTYGGISLYGIMIAQMLYQVFYYTEAEHHKNFE